MILNHTVVAELDATLATLDGKLTASVSTANAEIDTIHSGTSLSSTDYVAYVALSFSIISFATCLLAYCLYRKHGLQHPCPHDKCSCGKLCLPTSAGDQAPPGIVQEECVHSDTLDGGSHEERLRTGLYHVVGAIYARTTMDQICFVSTNNTCHWSTRIFSETYWISLFTSPETPKGPTDKSSDCALTSCSAKITSSHYS